VNTARNKFVEKTDSEKETLSSRAKRGIRLCPLHEIAVRNLGLFSILLTVSFSASAADFKEIPYAEVEGVRLTLDAHVPEGPGPFPAAILVHGGGWIAGDKQEFINYLFAPLSEAGFAWFSINYRLAPKYIFPAPADDVERAIAYVQGNAKKYRIDPDRVALIGESAGGHLVSYVGIRNRRSSRVAAVVSMYGVHDFITACEAWKPIPGEILQLFGIRVVDATTAPALIKASPVLYVSRDTPPFLLMHGSKDEDVPYAQSVEMCDKMKQAGARCDLITIEGAPTAWITGNLTQSFSGTRRRSWTS
jgi:acetyl esterase